jgi:hypothetical protein
MGHDIVSPALLLLSGDLKFLVFYGGVIPHLLNGFVGDGQAELYTAVSCIDVGLARGTRRDLSRILRATAIIVSMLRIGFSGKRDISSHHLSVRMSC